MDYMGKILTNKSHLTRRNFLKRTAATAVSALGAPYIVPASIFGANAPSNRVNVGCIGTGNQGVQDLKGFLNQDDVQVLAVCDVNRASYGYAHSNQYLGWEPAQKIVNEHYSRKKRSGQYKGCDAYTDFREVLARNDIDAVTVVLPDHWHAVVTIRAAETGKDIYCEKPLSLTIAEGRAMVEAVKQYGVILQTGTHHRSDEHIRRGCELVRNGRIGEVKRAIVVLGPHGKREYIGKWQPQLIPKEFDYDMWLGPAPWAPYHSDRCLYRFRFFHDYAGGETTNTGAHCFDVVQWALNTEHTGPVEIEDTGSEWPKDGLYDAVSKVSFRAEYANNVELICGPTGKSNLAARFEGTEGWLEIPWWNRLISQPQSLVDSVIGTNEIHLYRSKNHYRNFLDCVKTRCRPITPVEIGHRSATVCHLGNIAMRLKRKLHWNPEAERFTNDDQANRLLSRSPRAPWHL
ncbi:MAG: Gfo/Idh/MocA family oxidoreductase [Sedimentisphaerales bacterium]|nr:Gfo/Idh/MocA family oxidoreductase [Sedimentisphaerales bacterium]